jgi:hypothetical protein
MARMRLCFQLRGGASFKIDGYEYSSLRKKDTSEKGRKVGRRRRIPFETLANVPSGTKATSLLLTCSLVHRALWYGKH